MNENEKRGLVALVAVIGIIVMFIGLLTGAYNFWIGFILGIVVWYFAGMLARDLGVCPSDGTKNTTDTSMQMEYASELVAGKNNSTVQKSEVKKQVPVKRKTVNKKSSVKKKAPIKKKTAKKKAPGKKKVAKKKTAAKPAKKPVKKKATKKKKKK